MTPEQVAKNFHSECRHDLNADVGDVWCVVHDSIWHQENCDTMIDYIDLAEQAVEAWQTQLRSMVMAMPSWAVGKNRDGHTALWINKDDLLHMIGELR